MADCPFPNAIRVFSQWRIPESDLARLIQAGRVEPEPSAAVLLSEAKAAKGNKSAPHNPFSLA